MDVDVIANVIVAVHVNATATAGVADQPWPIVGACVGGSYHGARMIPRSAHRHVTRPHRRHDASIVHGCGHAHVCGRVHGHGHVFDHVRVHDHDHVIR